VERFESKGSPSKSAEVSTGAAGASHTGEVASWPRRVLFCVCGLSPQIVTETVYALAFCVAPRERFVPTEIHVLSTAVGAARALGSLLHPETGAFARLLRDHALPDIRFDANCIHTVCDESGRPLQDIRTEQDNAELADALTHRIRALTQDPESALHVSLAGGRKTMSFYAGYALSLFGREQDRLSHVLVDPAVESSPGFFYPAPHPKVAQRTPRPHGTAPPMVEGDAPIGLALIPFVRLREGLPRALLEGRSGFAQTIAAANAGRAPPSLGLDPVRHTIVADGISLRLPPFQFALLAALAARAQSGRPALRAPAREAHDAEWADEVLADLRRVLGTMHIPLAFEESLRTDCSGSRISPQLSKLRQRLADALAPGRPALYFDDGGQQRHKRYRVPLAAEAIWFGGLPAAASLPIGGTDRDVGTFAPDL
jgi:CRISPR-associated protein (TIGR02584 family)